MTPRSYLYVPGDSAGKLARARDRGADAIIIDLEDAILPASRPEARRLTAEALPTSTNDVDPQVWVRVNAPPEMAEDIPAIARPGITGVIVPKADSQSLAEADRLLTIAEAHHDLPPGSIALLALIESARGLLVAAELAVANRVVRLGLGEADLMGELRMRPSADRSELTALRLQVVLASAAAGLPAPVAPVEIDLNDDQRLLASTQALRALGFGARTAIHPRQVPVIHKAFTPTAEEVAQAQRTVATLAEAQTRGSGAGLTGRGQFVDPAVARTAYETISAYEGAMRRNDHIG